MKELSIKTSFEFIAKLYKNRKIAGLEVVHQFRSIKDTDGYIGIYNEKTVVIAFKGTDSFQDVVTDLNVKKQKYTIYRNGEIIELKVHKGF